MVGQGTFSKLLDKATSQLLLEPDLPTTLAICDAIRQGDVTPKVSLGMLKKKLTSSSNPHIILHTLLVLESIVKNCPTVHEELSSRAFLDTLHDLLKTTFHANIRNKILELFQAWSQVFKNNSKFEALHDIVNQMKAEGFKFPTLRESEAMFTATNAPTWVDGESCHRCRVQFTLITRKHHCRACGQVFCNDCTQKSITLPKFGIEKEVRVCDSCYAEATKASTSKTSTKTEELPFEYLKSSLYQQSQKQQPPKKSDYEIQEEEDLNLAIALSQSEAESKEKERASKFKSSTSPTYNSSSYKPDVSKPTAVVVEPTQNDDDLNPELIKYLNRSYWESRTLNERPTSPSAPSATTIPTVQNNHKNKENGVVNIELEEFMNTLKSQVEIFINRMKSNSSRGRSIANDTSVQTLFMNITAMHSKLLTYIKEHDDSRLHFEILQDKLNQVKDARAALDALREEHRDKLRREAEEAERLRQMQMAQKLEIMRKKKQEYLQYQRQLVLQRVQEQEREMQMRQEQQKQVMMGAQQFQMGYNVVQQYPGIPPNQQQHPGYYLPPPHSGMVQNQPQMGHPMGHPVAQMAPGYNQMAGPPHQGNPQGNIQDPQQMQQPMGMPYSTNQPNQGLMGGPRIGMPQYQQQQPGAPPASPQVSQQPNLPVQQNQPQPAPPAPPQQQQQQKEETQTAELISFD